MNGEAAVDEEDQVAPERGPVRDLRAEVVALGRAIEAHRALLRGERCSWPGCPVGGAVRCRRGL